MGGDNNMGILRKVTALPTLYAFVLLQSALAGPYDVRINELHYHPAGEDQALEFVELHNTGETDVDLSGWSFTSGITYTFPSGVVIPAFGYLVVAKDPAALQEVFGPLPVVGPYEGFLSDGGEWIRLEDSRGRVIEEFSWSDSAAWPQRADGRGASLELIRPRAEPDWGDSWASSVVVNGTPGSVNSHSEGYEEQTILTEGAQGRYFKGVADPPADWTDPDFDDSSWPSGPSGFGYGDGDDATVLTDMQGNYSTVYVRMHFSLTDTDFRKLSLSVVFDDGFVAYLNGQEVARFLAPGSPGEFVPHTALAADLHEYTDGPAAVDLTAFIPLLREGDNVLALVGLNESLDSSDLSLAATLSGVKRVLGIDEVMGRRVVESVIRQGERWRYFKGTEEPPEGWTAVDFDDSAWPAGVAGFGYGDNDDATVLEDMQRIPGTQPGYSTLYLRRTFSLQGDPQSVHRLYLRIDYDDGFVAYLNGVEVARSPNVTGSPPAHDALATAQHEAGAVETYDITAFRGLLSDGVNCLAVQGLNTSLESSDFSLHPELVIDHTVRARPEALSCPVEINEIAPSAVGGWIELFNPSDAPWDLSSYRLGLSPRQTALYGFPQGTIIQPHSFLVVNEQDLGAQIPTAGVVLLTDPAGLLLVDSRAYDLKGAAAGSCARYPDGRGPMKVVPGATPGEPNTPPLSHDVVINEIMYHPAAAPGEVEPEWIELWNTGSETLDLTGWAFTRGIDFRFPDGTTLPAGGFLVVAKDPDRLTAEYGTTNVVGPFESGLKNDEELILLRDNYGNQVDRVHYADDGRWPTEADGGGPSIELINPAYDNRSGQAWAASAGAGTPGAMNSAYQADVPPLVRRVRHSPAVPSSASPVTISCSVESPTSPIARVTLYWKIDGQDDFTATELSDDGASGDGEAGDGVWGVILNPFPAGTVVCFAIVAESETGKSRTVPASWAQDQSVTMLFQVQDDLPFWSDPTYRIVMTADRIDTLRSRSIWSDELLDATFIAGEEIFYNVGIRYRGRSARYHTPKSYRVQLTDDEKFRDMKRININGYRPETQHLGMGLFRVSRVPAPISRPVRFVFDNKVVNRYVHMEAVHEGFLRRRFPGDDEGNLYRGEQRANLDWRGSDKEAYRPYYLKRTNVEEDDFSDIMELCYVFDRDTTPDDEVFYQRLQELVDIEEWARFFAVHTVISTQEGGIYRDKGDDYYLYRRPSDGKWVLIPWDVDDSFLNPTERLFRPTVPSIVRFLHHPAVTPYYYAALKELTGGAFSEETIGRKIDELIGIISENRAEELHAFAQQRRTFIDERVPTEFHASLGPDTLVSAESETWRYFRGTTEPSGGTTAWTAVDFDDSSWPTGPGGFGYGDGDDATVLDDMRGNYTTVYLRHTFTVDDPSEIQSLALAVLVDDGFVAYLNGTEVARFHAPGAPGDPVPAGSTATADWEARTPLTFRIENAGGILRRGTNVLALQGLNSSLNSSDFSLAATLGRGVLVAEGCPGDLYVAGTDLLISGVTSVADTFHVVVNGEEIPFDPMTGEFEALVSIAAGVEHIIVEALREDLSIYDRAEFTVTVVQSIGGVLPGDRTLEASGGPYLVGGSLVVPAGVTLTVEPGTELIFREGVTVRVEGGISAEGTQDLPIVLSGVSCVENWGAFDLRGTTQDNRFAWCVFKGAGALGSSPAALTVRSGNVALSHCTFEDISGDALFGASSTISVADTTIRRADRGVVLEWCPFAAIERTLIEDLQGTGTCISVNGSMASPVAIVDCTVGDTPGVGVTVENGAVRVSGCTISGCGKAGLSLYGSQRSIVEKSLIHHNHIGIALHDSHRALLDHNTIVDNTKAGIVCSEATEGRGSGHAEVRSCIVYFNGEALQIDDLGTAAFAFSDIEMTPLPPGEGNFNSDPLFTDHGAAQYSLSADSPCIGAGENGTDVGAIPYTDVPGAPRSLRVVGVTSSSIALAWDDASVNEDGFELYRKGPGEEDFQLIAALAADTTSYVDVGLTLFETYTYRIRAFNDQGYSDWSNEISVQVQPTPSAPTDLVVLEVTANAIALGWKDNSDDESGFELYRTEPNGETFSLLVRLGPDVTTYRDDSPPLEPGALYRYRVRAYNASGASGWSNTVEQRTGIPPSAPENLSVLSYGVDGITIGWTDTSDNEQGFEIQIKEPQSGEWRVRATVAADTTRFEDTGLQQDTVYSYRVRSFNEAGASAWAGPVSRKTGKVPEPPQDFSVVDVGADWILLAWGEAEGTGYELERAVEEGPFEPLSLFTPGTLSYADTGLATGTTYRYRLRTINAFATSAWSSVAVGTTGHLPQAPADLAAAEVAAWPPPDTQPRPLPSEVTYTVTLTWDDRADNEVGFELQRRIGEEPWSSLIELPADWESYTDRDIPPGASLSYRIRALNRFGHSEWSNEVALRIATAPAAPANVRITEVGVSSLTVQWEDRSENELWFEVERRPEGGRWQVAGVVSADQTTFRDQDLQPDTSYTYRVWARSPFQYSLPSEEVTGRTGRAPNAPSSLHEKSWSTEAITLGWEYEPAPGTELVVKRRSGRQGPWIEVARFPGEATSWTDQNVESGEVYEYRIEARNEFGSSEPSSVLLTCAGVKILQIAPAEGHIEGGDPVEIRGIHFEEGLEVTFGGRVLGGLSVVDSGRLTGVVPPGKRAGAVDVALTWNSLSDVVPAGYRYSLGLLHGDANGNNFVSIADAIYILSYLFRHGEAPYCKALADVNNDGSLDISDATFLLNYLFGGGPGPYPERVDCR